MKIWTTEEEENLIDAMKIRTKIIDIAKEHQRSETAIKLRLVHIMKRMLKKGEPFSKLTHTFNLNKDDIDVLFSFADKYTKNVNENKTNSNTKTSITSKRDNNNTDLLLKIKQIEDKLDKLEKILKSIYKKVK